jgi:spore germination protein YaaH/uncharacterized protein YraI
LSRRVPVILALAVAASALLPSVARAVDPVPSPSVEPGPVEAAAVVLADGTVLPPMPESGEPSVHAEMLAEHAGDAIAFPPGGAPTVLRSLTGKVTTTADAIGPSVITVEGGGGITALPNGMRKEVLGFLPYWMLDAESMASMNYQLVSTIAYFSVGATSTGNLDKGTTEDPSTGWAGWRSSAMTTVIDRAHAAGARVVLTVTMMAWDTAAYDRMRTLLTSATNRGRLVGQIVDAVRSRGADGVNLDFEMVPTDMRAQYTSFVRQLKAALTTAGVGSYLTVCTTGGAATWATGYDVAALTAAGAADHLFVMGYDFHWSGSTRAGGVAPVDSPYVLDVSSAMADFLEQAPAAKLIWGVPYYGRGWNTTSNQLNGVTTGGSFSYFYTAHRLQATTYGRLWDAVGKVPWYRYYDSTVASWTQVYYDDAVSLGVKYDLVNRYGLAGTGMWTLLMDAGRPELWRLLADRFVTDTTPPAGGVATLPERTRSLAIPVSWLAIDYQSGLERYNVQVRDRTSSTWSAWLTGTTATSGTFLGTPGHAYEFRVQAVDWKGNAQPWLTAPGRPATVTPGAFARSTTTLNVRSGAGTSYAIVGTLAPGDRVYVMSGPVAAGGLSWMQVQYGFAEWPSSEYARIGWVALGAAGESYLSPAYAPSVTRIDPFIADYRVVLPAFSPNGDGSRDTAAAEYTLPEAVDDLQVDIVTASDVVVRHLDLGPQAAGWNRISWDGRTDAGTTAPYGRYLVKIAVTVGGETIVTPSPRITSQIAARWGFILDLDPPAISGATPVDGSSLLAASSRFSVTFDEGMIALTPSTVRLEAVGGAAVPVVLGWNVGARTLSVTPAASLAADTAYRLTIDGATSDVAGNRLLPWSIDVWTAPGDVYAPAKRVTVQPGTYTAYRIGSGGDVLEARRMSFTKASGASVGHRATLPNLPGRWLHIENGAWSGLWLPESPSTGIAGRTEHVGVPSTTRLTFAAGSHTGYRFSAAGATTATKPASLSKASGANVSARAVINGRAYWWVTNGIWAGWWIPETSRSYRAGFVDEMAFSGAPRVAFAAGTYTGYVLAADGSRGASRTATLTKPSGAPVDGWAIVNGRAYYHVSAGIWASLWVPATGGVTLAP